MVCVSALGAQGGSRRQPETSHEVVGVFVYYSRLRASSTKCSHKRYIKGSLPRKVASRNNDYITRGERGLKRTFNNLGEGIFRLVGCSDVLVPVGIKARAKTRPNPLL